MGSPYIVHGSKMTQDGDWPHQEDQASDDKIEVLHRVLSA